MMEGEKVPFVFALTAVEVSIFWAMFTVPQGAVPEGR